MIPPNTGNIIRLCANTGATLHGADFAGAWLTGAALSETTMRQASFRRAKLERVQMMGASVQASSFLDLDADHANFHQSTML